MALVQDANREKGLGWRTYHRVAVHVRVSKTIPHSRSIPGTGEVERTGEFSRETWDACYVVPWNSVGPSLDFLVKEGDATYEIVAQFGVDGEFHQQAYK